MGEVVFNLVSYAGRRSGLLWIWIGGVISVAVSGFHVLERSISLAMASIWLWFSMARV